MNDFNSFERDVADRLQQQARSIDIVDTPVANVIARGRQRADHRRVAVGIAVVIALSGTVIGTVQVLSKPVSHRVQPTTDSEPSEVATPNVSIVGEVPPADLTPVTRIESNMVWNMVEPDSSEALGSVIWDNSALSNQKPPYLTWSTSPGKTISPSGNQDFIPTLYRSDDGIHWTPAGGESFTQPDISMRGVGSRNGRMFAFGTAAASAPIPNGGGGEVVVDVSDDQGASWRHIQLPVDLRGLASAAGVQSVGYQGDMVATDSSVVALGVPAVNIDPSKYPGGQGNVAYFPHRDGAVRLKFPDCSAGTASTIASGGGYTKTTVGAVAVPGDTTPVDPCSANTPQESDLIPWADLGVDPTAIATMFAPRVFVSTDGENFVEGAFPTLPDGYQMSQLDLVASGSGFVASAMLYEPSANRPVAKLYTSPDGMTWNESDMPAGQYNSINVLPDGTIVAFGVAMPTGQSFTAVSSDGVEWSKLSLANLLDAEDGKSAQLSVWMSSAGPGGITVVAGIDTDAALEAGGFSMEKDGVRLTMTESRYQAMVATDIATGAEIGRWDGRRAVVPGGGSSTPSPSSGLLTYTDQGHYQVLNEDGSVRVDFTDLDVQSLYQQASVIATPKSVLLHSADGLNWSRDDMKPLIGFDSFGATRVQVTDSNVLVSVVDGNHGVDGLPRTVMLVGTAKS
jgi:hypothetical protein